MRMANPQYIYLFLIFPFLVLVILYGIARKKAEMDRFVSEALQFRMVIGYSALRRNLKIGLFMAGAFFLILCALGPRWGFHWEEVKREGVDIVIVMDTSDSMLSEDVKPNRLERAKREVVDLISMLRGDRIGLVVFSGGAFLQCPLTLDYGACMMFVDYIDTTIVPQEGTNLAAAIEKAVQGFDERKRSSKAIILISDGGNLAGDPMSAAREAKAKGIKIYAIGIGREDEEVPIPLTEGGFKYNKGKMVTTKLEDMILQNIALATGGAYVRSITGDLDLEKIYYEEIHKKLERHELESTRRKRWEERFQWPLLLAFAFFLAEALLAERKGYASN